MLDANSESPISAPGQSSAGEEQVVTAVGAAGDDDADQCNRRKVGGDNPQINAADVDLDTEDAPYPPAVKPDLLSAGKIIAVYCGTVYPGLLWRKREN